MKLKIIFILFFTVSTIPVMAEELPFDSSRTRTEIPVEDVCGPNTILVDGICTPDCGEDEYLDGHCVEKTDNNFSTYMALFIFSMIPVWFAISGVYLAFGKKHRKLISVILVIIGILWIIGIYTNTLPVSFG